MTKGMIKLGSDSAKRCKGAGMILKARIEELESNERAYEEIIGPMTYRQVAGRIKELEGALQAIMKAIVEGRVCDDVAWFDSITTLYDFCDIALNRPDLKAGS